MNENIHPVSNNIFLDYMLLFKYESTLKKGIF